MYTKWATRIIAIIGIPFFAVLFYSRWYLMSQGQEEFILISDPDIMLILFFLTRNFFRSFKAD